MQDFTLKPDISAPGVQIVSTGNDDGYKTMSGTSMAGPFAAGSAALVMQKLQKETSLKNAELVQATKALLMNKGIDRATGDYLVFLNAGDVFPSDDTLEYVEGCVGEGENLPGVLYGDTDIVNDEGRFLRHRRLSPPRKLNWRSFKWGMLVCHQSFYARTDIARQIHYDLHYRLSADVDWCIRIMKAAQQRHLPLRNVHAVITNYLDGGMSVQNHKASLKERFEVMRSNYDIVTTVLVHTWFVVRSLFKR